MIAGTCRESWLKNSCEFSLKVVPTVLRIRIRDPVPFDPGPGSGIRNRFFFGSRIPTPYFLELSDKFLGKKFFNSLKTDPNFFLQHLKNKIILNFVKFVATKKSLTTNFFYPSLLLLFFNPGYPDIQIKLAVTTEVRNKMLDLGVVQRPYTDQLLKHPFVRDQPTERQVYTPFL